MRPSWGVLALASFVWLVPSPASALTLVSLSRSVSAETHAVDNLHEPTSDGASESVVAPDDGPFAATVAPSCSTLACPTATASQTSTVGTHRVTASGSAYGEADYAHEGLQLGWTRASSNMTLDFHMDEAAPFRLVASLVNESQSDQGFTSTDWVLQGSSFLLEGGGFGDAVHVGTLAAGDYRLWVDVVIQAVLAEYPHPNFPPYELGGYSLLLVVPEPAPSLLVALAACGLGLAREGRVRAARRAGR